jgi:two-component system, LuxR family, response regulator FixJ
LAHVPLIAIVDDDLALRQALAELCEVFDFGSEVFDCAESFIAAHVTGRFDCVMTDLNMPGMSGLALVERLGTIDPALPVIVMSAQTGSDVGARALRSGALAFLSKPIDDQVLHRHLIAAFSGSRRAI